MAGESLAAFPPPPPYYLLFRGPDPPQPPPPVYGECPCYGEVYSVQPPEAPGARPGGTPEEEAEKEEQEQHPEVRSELRRLGRELGILILELVDTLVERPSLFSRRVEDIKIALKEIQLRLSELRPQQARVTILHMLQTQLELRRQALADIKEERETVRSLVAKAGEELDISLRNIESHLR